MFKNVFLQGFKNDNFLSSKSYTVTKSEISPQQKLRSLRNLRERERERERVFIFTSGDIVNNNSPITMQKTH